MSQNGYSIGQVAKKIGIEAHTVRFWSNELSQVFNPTIGKGGRRYYTEEDVQNFFKIKELITVKKYRLSFIKQNGIATNNEIKPNQKGSIMAMLQNAQTKVNELLNLL